jgi:hypothetical protein
MQGHKDPKKKNDRLPADYLLEMSKLQGKAGGLTQEVWIFRLTRWRCRCVPEGRLESRPAIYRRYWCLEFDLVPEGRSKLGLAHG